MEDKKLNSLIGLCQRAGKIASGGFLALSEVRANKSKLIIIAEDASDNTKKRFFDKCKYYKVPIYEYGNMDMLGHIIGKGDRTVISISDKGFALTIKSRIEEIIEVMDR